MKKSVNDKLFLCFAILVFIVVGIIWILNTLILEEFYIYTKKHDLSKIYSSINKIYTNYDYDVDAKKIDSELEKIDSKSNVDIVIQNGVEITIYTTSKDFTRNRFLLNRDISLYLTNDYFKKNFKDGQNFYTGIINDSSINSDFVFLIGTLDNNFNIFVRTPMESIKESVLITNRFLIIGALVAFVICGIVAYIISNTFTKPLKELNIISQKMSKLDFSQKYEVTTDDEIGMLGTSINLLSSNLEKTIKELKMANMELEKDIEETSKISEMRNQFVSDVSHELKTPIALIQGYAEGLIDGIASDEESKKYYLNVILDEANKMAELTRGLLDLSNLEYGKNELNLQEFNLTELVNNLIKKQEIILNEKDIKVTFDFNENLEVIGDTFRIEQVLTNYFNNAIKHVNDKKEIKFTIENNDKDLVRVSVFNTGENINEEDMPRLWNRFYKVDSSRNREVGGTGIGLSLVRAIMKQHNMNYGVKNVDGGVVFWFELKKAN